MSGHPLILIMPKIVLITGASRGLGYALLQQMLQADGMTIVAISRNWDKCAALKDLQRMSSWNLDCPIHMYKALNGNQVFTVVGDFSDDSVHKTTVQILTDQLAGQLDTLILNAA